MCKAVRTVAFKRKKQNSKQQLRDKFAHCKPINRIAFNLLRHWRTEGATCVRLPLPKKHFTLSPLVVDIGDIDSPRAANVGGQPTRVDPKLFGKPSDFSGDRREWRHFVWVFRNWFGFLHDAAEEWLDQAERVHLGSLEKRSRIAEKRTMLCI